MTIAHAKGTFAKETIAQTQAWEGDRSSDEGYVTKCHQISLKFPQISCNITPSSREGLRVSYEEKMVNVENITPSSGVCVAERA